MAYEHSIQRYRYWYGWLLNFYPRHYYERFGEGMQQVFTDLLRERAGRGLFVSAAWMFVDTGIGIINENVKYMLTQRTLLFVGGMLCLLFIPFFSMQFQVGGWDWDGTDFTIMAVLLTGMGIALAAATNGNYPLKRRVIGFGALLLVLALYVHLAVGLVDTWPLAGS